MAVIPEHVRSNFKGRVNPHESPAGTRKPPFGCFSTEHAAKKLIDLAGFMKLFVHELFPDDVDKAIYVDTDAFFLTDLALL